MSDTGKPVPERGGRRRRPSIAALIAGGVLVAAAFLLTEPLPWPEALFTVLLLAVLPAVVLAAEGPPQLPPGATRHGIYTTTWVGLWTLAGLAAAAVVRTPNVSARLGLVMPAPRLVLGWSIALTVAGAAIVALWRAFGHGEAEIGRFLIPRTGAERLHYAWLSVTAGVTEEIVFRGFLVGAIDAAAGSMWLAVAVSSAVFGLAHRYQGTSGAARAGVLGAILCAPLVVLDSVVPAIVAHAALDLLAGLWWRERLWRETIVPPRSSL